MKEEIAVSVICIAYNHKKYIRQCLENVVKQKTSFNYEVIIHDDASTDGTVDIIKEFGRKYSGKVKLILQKENQHSKGKYVVDFAVKEAKGKYLALCECDDYWCDELKLQKQFDYMEENPGCALCFHNTYTYYQKSDYTENNWFFWKTRKYNGAGKYNSSELRELEVTPTSSQFFKKEDYVFWEELEDSGKKYGDMIRTLCLSMKGYGYSLGDMMSVYRREVEESTFSNCYRGVEGYNQSIKATMNTIKCFDFYSKYKFHNYAETKINEFSKQYIKMCDNEIEELLKSVKDIYIYGTGVYAEICMFEILRMGVEIKGFLVSDGFEKIDMYKGYCVKYLSEVIENKDIGIIVATGKNVRGTLLNNLKSAMNLRYCVGCVEIE